MISRVLIEIRQKLFLTDLEIMILINLIKQILNLLILNALQNALQLLLRDLPRIILIEIIKSFLKCLQLEELPSVAHASDELVEVYLP